MKTGEVFITTTGEYSDYGIHGVWIALVDFSLDAEIANRAKSDGAPDSAMESVALMDRLVREGKVQEFAAKEVNLGQYGRWNEDPAKDRGDAK